MAAVPTPRTRSPRSCTPSVPAAFTSSTSPNCSARLARTPSPLLTWWRARGRSKNVRVRPAEPALAQRQARWIVQIDPWRAMGYQAAPLGRWLSRSAKAKQVMVAGDPPSGLVVVQPDVLLGDF